jgi:hypothetical protein
MSGAIDRADRASSAAANLVRQDLGLPSSRSEPASEGHTGRRGFILAAAVRAT